MKAKYIYKRFFNHKHAFADIYVIIEDSLDGYYRAKLLETTSYPTSHIGMIFLVSTVPVPYVYTIILYETMEELMAEHIVEFL